MGEDGVFNGLVQDKAQCENQQRIQTHPIPMHQRHVDKGYIIEGPQASYLLGNESLGEVMSHLFLVQPKPDHGSLSATELTLNLSLGGVNRAKLQFDFSEESRQEGLHLTFSPLPTGEEKLLTGQIRKQSLDLGKEGARVRWKSGTSFKALLIGWSPLQCPCKAQRADAILMPLLQLIGLVRANLCLCSPLHCLAQDLDATNNPGELAGHSHESCHAFPKYTHLCCDTLVL